MAEAAVGFFLENLKQILVYNSELIGGVKDQIEELHSELILFKSFLRDATEKPSSDVRLQALVDKIIKVVYKAENAIEKLVVEQANYKARNALGKAIRAADHSVMTRDIAKEIESVRKEIVEIYKQERFGFQSLQIEQLTDRGATEKRPPVVEQDDVVGFDEEANTLIKRLTGEGRDLEVITIIGMTGLGKTTLARKIYSDPRIEYEFFNRAWVYVSQKYSKREVFLSILRYFTQRWDYTDKSDEFIATELRRCLEEGRYLIVMDDIWTKEAWDDLKVAFPNNNKGSRILITSQQMEVAHHASLAKNPHNLKFLTPEESWVLLEKKVFGREKCPQELQRLGQQIATKCKGLPLAIVVIAGILLNNRELSDWWRQVAQNVSSFIVTEQFMDVIALSYNHLPYHLKSCFLYLGVFPEDYEIPIQELIRLWIAEGFIQQSGFLSLEDVAESFAAELVNMNLLMIAQRRFNGRIKTCRVHDVLYKFCKMEAQKQNFYQEIKRSGQVTHDNYRRICIHSGVMEYISSNPSDEYVRSFLCFASDEIILPREHISTIFKAFKLLRVLDMRSITFETLPKDLLQLALLRYLALSCNIKVLPSSISRLWNMQTLIFITRSYTLEFKEDMWKMHQLRHLYTNASALLPRPSSSSQIGRENVQSLSMVSPESCTAHVFARTPNIIKLGVRGNLVVLFDNLFDNVGRLQYLTNLKLINVLPGPPSEGKIRKLPPAYEFPTKLMKLTLSDTFLDWEQMQILGNLEMLEVLKLKNNAFKGEYWEPKDGGFLSLKVLHIGRTDLVTWEASKHHFPSLKRLFLQHCEKLEAVPIGLADVASFHLLELYHSSKAAATSARRIQQKKKEGIDTNSGDEFKLSIYPPDI